MGVQLLSKSALILDYSMHDLDMKKKKLTREVFHSERWPQGQQGAQPPTRPTTSFEMRLRPRLKWQPPEVTPFGKRHELDDLEDRVNTRLA